jgi:hypothetical protein
MMIIIIIIIIIIRCVFGVFIVEGKKMRVG